MEATALPKAIGDAYTEVVCRQSNLLDRQVQKPRAESKMDRQTMEGVESRY